MTIYKVAYNAEAKVARIIGQDSTLAEGFELIGEFKATAVSPNPTDASTQHIHNMLYRAGVTDPSSITIEREPVTEVAAHQELTPATETGQRIEETLPREPELLSLTVGESVDLVAGSTKGLTFDVDTEGADDGVVKLDKRNAKVTALAAGTTTVTMTNEKEGTADKVVITVREAAAPSGAEGSQSGSDASEAGSA